MDGEITIENVRELIDDDGARIVDIRDERSFRRERIPGSENVPFSELPGRVEEFDDAERIVTVCPHGKASVQAARLIGSYEGAVDARIESMAGGLEAWADRYELESATESKGTEEPDAPF